MPHGWGDGYFVPIDAGGRVDADPAHSKKQKDGPATGMQGS